MRELQQRSGVAEKVVKRQFGLNVMAIGIVRKAIGRNKRDMNGHSLSQHLAEGLGSSRELRIFLRIYHIFSSFISSRRPIISTTSI